MELDAFKRSTTWLLDNKTDVKKHPSNTPSRFTCNFLDSVTFPANSFMRVDYMYNTMPYLPGKHPRHIFPKGGNVFDVVQMKMTFRDNNELGHDPLLMLPTLKARWENVGPWATVVDRLPNIPNVRSSDIFANLECSYLISYIFGTILKYFNSKQSTRRMFSRYDTSGPLIHHIDTKLSTLADDYEVATTWTSPLQALRHRQTVTGPEDFTAMKNTPKWGFINNPYLAKGSVPGAGVTLTSMSDQAYSNNDAGATVTNFGQADTTEGFCHDKPNIPFNALLYATKSEGPVSSEGGIGEDYPYMLFPVLDMRGDFLEERRHVSSPYPGYLGLDNVRYVPQINANDIEPVGDGRNQPNPRELYHPRTNRAFFNEWIVTGLAFYFYYNIFSVWNPTPFDHTWTPFTSAGIKSFRTLMNIEQTNSSGGVNKSISGNGADSWWGFFSTEDDNDQIVYLGSRLQFSQPNLRNRFTEVYLYCDLVKATQCLGSYQRFVSYSTVDNGPPVVTLTRDNSFMDVHQSYTTGALTAHFSIKDKSPKIELEVKSTDTISFEFKDQRDKYINFDPNSTTVIRVSFYTQSHGRQQNTSIFDA